MTKPERPGCLTLNPVYDWVHGDQAKVVAYIEHLEAQYIRDCEQITNLWERLGNYRSRIKELETESAARMDCIRHLRDERTELGIQIMDLEEQLTEVK